MALDWSKPSIKNEYANGAQSEQKKAIERAVSSYLRNNISFTCILVKDAKDRIRVEEALIATPEYFKRNNIARWQGKNNEPTGHILSSQVARVNHLYFACMRKDVATSILMGIDDEVMEYDILKLYLKYWINQRLKALDYKKTERDIIKYENYRVIEDKYRK